jgi:Prenyltransferase and squalene oxidase repeat
MRSRSPGRAALRPLLTAALGVALVLPPTARAGPLTRALDYLAAHQDPVGGGFSADHGTQAVYTAWGALAVAAAGEDVALWRRGRVSLRAAVLRPLVAPGLEDLERTAVAVSAVGADPRRAGGRNLIREVVRSQRPDGSIGVDPSTTAWGVLALASAGIGPGSPSTRAASASLVRAQRSDGGWSLTDQEPRSGPITTSTAVQALVAAGHDPRNSFALRRARAFLLSVQNRDGGYSPVVGGTSTALTTAWVGLGIRALGERPSRAPWDRGGGPMSFLVRLQRADGGVRNVASSPEPSIWATSQLALAFSGKVLPVSRSVTRVTPPSRTLTGVEGVRLAAAGVAGAAQTVGRAVSAPVR